MESRWRQNIPELGLVGYRYEWAARLLSGGEGYDYLAKIKGVTAAWNLFSVIVSEDMMSIVFTIVPSGGRRFPGTYDVEQD